MNREKILWLKIKSNSYYKVLLKLNELDISIYDNKKIPNYILIKTTYDNYQKMKKYLKSYNISIYENTGIYKLKDYFNKYKIFIISLILGIILLFITNNIIFKIDVKTSNKKIEKLLIKELNNYGLSPLKFKKNHKEIEIIVKKILDNNSDTLEWLEIKYNGLVMIVNVTEKTNNDKEVLYKNCDIIAKTDAKINNLNIYRGVPLKKINDYVIKGDTIITGSVIYNDEIKNTVCASGEVYGEVWYKVSVTVPKKEEYKEYTGKNRYNLNIKNNNDKYSILKSRLKNKDEEEVNLYKLNNFEINLVKEKEYVNKIKYLTDEEAINKATNIALDKIKLKLHEEEEILVQKVLKKEVNDSTIYLELFIVTKESIGKMVVIEGSNINDVKSN